MSVISVGFAKVWMWIDRRLWAVRNRNGGWSSEILYSISWKICHRRKISCVWRRERIGKEHHSLLYKFFVPLLWGDVMLCGKETLVVNEKPFDQKEIPQFSKDVLKGKFFVFE